MKLLFAFCHVENVIPLLDALRQSGFDVSWKRVETAVEMRAVLSEGLWEAVLFDGSMGDFSVADGLDIMDNDGRGIPFIVLSEKGGMEPFVSLVKRGVSDFVAKDNLDNLASTITRELQCSQLRREIVRNEKEIRRLANYDCLTGLPNRRLLIERLTHGLKRARRQDLMCSLLFVDLDKFKSVNDTLGHYAGDILLREMAKRLQSCVRETDTVARTGGDEFIIVLEDVDHENRGAKIAEMILDAMKKPFILDKAKATISASIGIAVYPADGDSVETLLPKADVAMYQVKDEGRNGFMMYKPGMEAKKLRFRQEDRPPEAENVVNSDSLPLSVQSKAPSPLRMVALHILAMVIIVGGVFFAIWKNDADALVAHEEMLDFDPNMNTSAGQ